jgi:hypothetical protein
MLLRQRPPSLQNAVVEQHPDGSCRGQLSALGGAMEAWVVALVCVAVVAVGYSVGHVLGFVVDRHRPEE